jgi:NAD(P)-dependent dehydrogenase (short-subunit alcohol dehydrogenase family)
LKRLLVTGAQGQVGQVLSQDLGVDYDLLENRRTGELLWDFDVCSVAAWEAASAGWSDGLDGVIHTVGAFHYGPLETMSAEAWTRVVSTNLDAAFYAYKHTIEALRKRRGCLIFFTLAGLQNNRPEPHAAAYAAAKTALTSLAQSIADIESKHGVRCNMIAPGLLHNEAPATAQHYKVPLGRSAQEHELCAVVRYLLGDSAAQVTGTTLPLSGGWRL